MNLGIWTKIKKKITIFLEHDRPETGEIEVLTHA